MLSTPRIPGAKETGRLHAVRLFNESLTCRFTLGRQTRPYRVLGYMETQSAPLAVWKSGKSESIKPAVKEAIKHGADALVLLATGTNISGSTTFSSGQWRSNTTTTGGVYGNYFNAQSRTTGGGFASSATVPIRKGYARVIANCPAVWSEYRTPPLSLFPSPSNDRSDGLPSFRIF
jgi:hypothetical protein